MQRKKKIYLIPKNIRLSLYICSSLFFITLGAIAFLYPNLQPQIPLYYNLANPSSHLANKKAIIFPLLGMLITCGLNFSLLFIFKDLNRIIVKVVSVATVAIIVIFTATIFRLLLIIN